MGTSSLGRATAIGLAVLLVTVLGVMMAASSIQQLWCSVSGVGGNDADPTDAGDSTVPLPSSDPAARLQVSVVSWNSYYRNSVGNILRGFDAIEAAGGDVVGLQEQNSESKRRELARRLAPAWAFVGLQTRQPIAYRTADYQLLASGVVKAHGPHRIEPGPGGKSVGTKWVVWVELRDVHTRATFAVVGDHKIAAVEHSGHPRKDNPVRVRLWHEEDKAVGRVIAQLEPLGIPIFKTADENLAARRNSAFGYDELMKKRGMYSNWRVLGYSNRGTHGSRLIDYVWSTTRLAAPVRQRVLGKFGSDHSILVVDLDNQEAASVAAVATTSGASTRPSAPRPAIASRGAAAVSTTSADEKAVWGALLASGFDTMHAAAAMGNMQDESGFDPQIVQGGGHSKRPADAGGRGYGLVQWTPGRKLSDYIGSAEPTVQNEVATLKAQLDGKGPHPEKAAGVAFWAATDTATAARVFHLRYERSASKDSSHRVSNALGIERRLQGTATDSNIQAGAQCEPAGAPGNTNLALGGTRTVTDPTSHKTYRVQIPGGPRGVAINFALDQLGKQYVWGGHGPDVFDCSGLVSAAWAKAGVRFTPQTEAMYRELPHVDQPQPGDLTYHPGHTQMVLNDGLILEAPRTGLTVRIIDRNWMKPTAWFDPTQLK